MGFWTGIFGVWLAALAAGAAAHESPVPPDTAIRAPHTGGATTGAAQRSDGISEVRWLAAGADIVRFLTVSPGECLKRPKDEQTRYKVEIGRAAFRNPLLLGGSAARSGLSCNSCHRDGRGNPAFFLEGLSGAPGSADVTSALFSTRREDGIANPRPIPDLVDAARKSAFGSTGAIHSLEDFIGGAVIDEFQGAPPPPDVLDGLVAYVGHLRSEECPRDAPRRTERHAMKDVGRAIAAADAALARGDGAAADIMLLAAQQELKPVAERFGGAGLAAERALILNLARQLGAIRAIAQQSPLGARARIDDSRLDARRLRHRLHARREASLYDPAHLKAHFNFDPSPRTLPLKPEEAY